VKAAAFHVDLATGFSMTFCVGAFEMDVNAVVIATIPRIPHNDAPIRGLQSEVRKKLFVLPVFTNECRIG
jgi:hypothetical protein